MIEERLKMEKERLEAEEQDRIAKIPQPRANMPFIAYPPNKISGRTLTPITVYTRMKTRVIIKPTKTTMPPSDSLIQWDIPAPPHASKFNIWTVGRNPTVDEVRRLPLKLFGFYKDIGKCQTDVWSNHWIYKLENLRLELYEGKLYFVFHAMNQNDNVSLLLFTSSSKEKDMSKLL